MGKSAFAVVLAMLLFFSVPATAEARAPGIGPAFKLLEKIWDRFSGRSSDELSSEERKRLRALCEEVKNRGDNASLGDREKELLKVCELIDEFEEFEKSRRCRPFLRDGLFRGFRAEVKSVLKGCHDCDGLKGDEVATWFHKTASQGDADGQYALGILHARGAGVLQNKTVAAEWFRKAAEQGHPKAQYVLAAMYDHGEGVAQDAVEAARWLDEAIENSGNLKGIEWLHRRGALESIKRFYTARIADDCGEARHTLALGKIYAAEGRKFHKAARRGDDKAQRHALNAYGNAYFWLFYSPAAQGIITEAEAIWEVIAKSMTYDECHDVILRSRYPELFGEKVRKRKRELGEGTFRLVLGEGTFRLVEEGVDKCLSER